MSPVEENLRSLTQRQLRNESGAVLRSVAAGESFVVTNNGVPVARIVPIESVDVPIVRPAVRRGGWSRLGIERASHLDLATVLDDVRADR